MKPLQPMILLVPLVLVLACCAGGGSASPAVSVFEKEVDLSVEGEAALTITASAPGTDWARAGAEAATVSVRVDGVYRSDVVLFRGAEAFRYETLVGPLAAGRHKVSLFLEPSKSAPAAREVRVQDVAVRLYPKEDPLWPVMAHAPVLYGRNDARSTDTPLLCYHEISREGTATTVQYTFVFSNEDGGTAADALMARWGRLTDIEWTYRVVLDAAGAVVRAEFQDGSHGTSPFRGKKEGAHPLLRDVTRNNLFADDGTSPYRFRLVPAEALPDASREEMMDLHPWTYRVMAEEWGREKQSATEQTADPSTRAVSDPRNYLYVEYRTAAAPGGASDARLAVQAKLRGDGRWYSSDHGAEDLRIQSRGWRRCTIELPPGTAASAVEALRVVSYAPGRSVLTDVRKAFLLDAQYAPGPSVIRWSGKRELDPSDPAAAAVELPAPAGG